MEQKHPDRPLETTLTTSSYPAYRAMRQNQNSTRRNPQRGANPRITPYQSPAQDTSSQGALRMTTLGHTGGQPRTQRIQNERYNISSIPSLPSSTSLTLARKMNRAVAQRHNDTRGVMRNSSNQSEVSKAIANTNKMK